jgi:hypothetical protein
LENGKRQKPAFWQINRQAGFFRPRRHFFRFSGAGKIAGIGVNRAFCLGFYGAVDIIALPLKQHHSSSICLDGKAHENHH